MFDIFPLMTTAAILAIVAISSQAGVLHPATVDPFANPNGAALADPGAATLAASDTLTRPIEAVTPQSVPTGWRGLTLGSLSEVEGVLDALESAGVECRAVDILGSDRFCVRWKE